MVNWLQFSSTIFFTLLFRLLRIIWTSHAEQATLPDVHQYAGQPIFWPLTIACFAWWIALLIRGGGQSNAPDSKSLEGEEPPQSRQSFPKWMEPYLASRTRMLAALFVGLAMVAPICLDAYWVLVTSWRICVVGFYLWPGRSEIPLYLHAYYLVGLTTVVMATCAVWIIFGMLVVFHFVSTMGILLQLIRA
jgi:hypothetical protein